MRSRFDTDGNIADSIWSVGPVSLRDRTVVAGNVTSGGAVTAVNGARVTGTTTPNTTIQTRTVTISVSFPSSSDNRAVSTDLGILAPGAYGTFNFNSNGAVTLTAGTYFFQGLSFNSGSTMRIDSSGGSIFVYVMTTLAFQRATQTSVAGNPAALRVVCFGTGTVFLQATFTGTVVAPAATLNLQGTAAYNGAFFGLSISGGPNLTYTRNPFPNWPETPSNPSVVAPAKATPTVHRQQAAAEEHAPRHRAKDLEKPKRAAARSRSKKKK